ncbi:MAG: ATP synthase F1 subunit delta [Candidatus Omnitrophota bacterium]
MLDDIIVKRYAEAFMGFAKKTIGFEKANQDFKALKDIMRENPEFYELLCRLEVSYTEKCDFIDKVLETDFSVELRQFLKLLLEKKRIDKIHGIADYIRIAYAHPGETDVLLKTSFPLDLDLIKKIEDKLREKLNQKFRFYIDLDGSLLGGVQIVIGNTVLDGSIRRRLEELKEKLSLIRV